MIIPVIGINRMSLGSLDIMASAQFVTSHDIKSETRGRKRQYENDAARQAACRARKNTRTLSVQLSVETFDLLNNFLKFKDETKDHCVERALKSFFRKR